MNEMQKWHKNGIFDVSCDICYDIAMSLSIGIVGLPNVGKSTLFQALTKKEVAIANYPFVTIDPNVGVVAVPDERLEKLAVFSHSLKKIPAVVEFVDIAGLVRGANKGEGLGNQFLGHIREVDAVVYVVRAFEDPNIQHVENRVDPKADVEILTTELILKDLETVGKHLVKVHKDARGGSKEAVIEVGILEKLQKGLEDGVMAYKTIGKLESDLEREQVNEIMKGLQLLTAKKGIFVLNVSHGMGSTKGRKAIVGQTEPLGLGLEQYLDSFGFPQITINAREELEGAGFSDEERAEIGLGSAKLPELSRVAYETLGLITFFTTGEDETRAWTVKQGSTAPEAAGVIHTDFQEKFIRADVIPWDALLGAGSWSGAKTKGVMQTVGKEYIMKDGDVMEVKHAS